jgi:hypothetical protein
VRRGLGVSDRILTHFTVRGDDVGAVGQTPGDRVQGPEEGQVDCACHVGLLELGTEGGGRFQGGAEENDPNVDQGGATTKKITANVLSASGACCEHLGLVLNAPKCKISPLEE